MSPFNDRFGAFTPTNMSPEELRMALIRSKLQPPAYPGQNDQPNRGVTLNLAPTVAPVAASAEIPTVIKPSSGGPADDPSAPPFRLGGKPVLPDGTTAPVVTPASDVPFTQPVVKKPFPTEDASAVPYAAPVVNAGPGGVTLNSTPSAPGWAGTVGIPAPSSDYQKGQTDEKLMSGLEEMAKGMKPKVNAPPPLAPPNLEAGQSNQLAYQLMAALMSGKKNRGLTLTGQ